MVQNSSVTARPTRCNRIPPVSSHGKSRNNCEGCKEIPYSPCKDHSGQRFLLVGVQEQDITDVRRELGNLGMASITPGVRSVQSCPGIAYCKNGTQDSIHLARRSPMNMREKNSRPRSSSVSPAPAVLQESRVRDIGIMGTAKGWTIFFGGHSGFKSRQGEQVATASPQRRYRNFSGPCLIIIRPMRSQKRSSRFLERVGERNGLGM